jgi:hypothetical protein
LKTPDESINQFFNQNWREVAAAVQPIILKTVEDILLDIMQKLFHQVPGDFLVSDLPSPSVWNKESGNEGKNDDNL